MESRNQNHEEDPSLLTHLSTFGVLMEAIKTTLLQKINQMKSQNQNHEEDPSLVTHNLSTFGVLREAIKTTRRNGKLAMSILLLVFLTLSQLEWGCDRVFIPAIDDYLSYYWPTQSSQVTSFQNQQRVLVETSFLSPQPKQNPYSYQRAYPSSYNGYMGQGTKQANKGEGAYSYQRAYPTSYNGYTGDQSKQASERKGAYSYQQTYPSSDKGYKGDQSKDTSEPKRAYSYQRAYPSSYNGYTGDQSKEASDRKGAYSYQRAYPSSYNGYTGHKEASERKGAYSYPRPYQSSYYGYTAWNKDASKSKGAYSYQRTTPSSYSYMGQTIPIVEQKSSYSYRQANPSSYETMPKGMLKEVQAILRLYSLILVLTFAVLLFLLVAAVSSSYEAYTAKVMNLKDVFLKFRESWKRPIHTGFCLTLINLGLFILLAFFIGLISIFTEGTSAYVLYFALIVSGSVWYFHMAALWMLSFVVSVLESDSSGLKAIIRAGELMKGKRRQAYFLILLFNFTTAGVNRIAPAYIRNLYQWSEVDITIPFIIGSICVFKLLMFVAFTVYYHERKMNQMEEKVEGRLGLYVPVASDEV